MREKIPVMGSAVLVDADSGRFVMRLCGDNAAVLGIDRRHKMATMAVVFWNAAWALMQIETGRADHDYAAMAAGMFQFLEGHLTPRQE